MAQTTPTHASGFHLFTVAMTGHAEDKGFNYRSMKQLNRCCPNAVKRAGAREWDCIGMNKGLCLPGTSEDIIVLHRCHRSRHRNIVY